MRRLGPQPRMLPLEASVSAEGGRWQLGRERRRLRDGAGHRATPSPLQNRRQAGELKAIILQQGRINMAG